MATHVSRSRGTVAVLTLGCAMISLLAGVWGGHKFAESRNGDCGAVCSFIRTLARSLADLLGLTRAVEEDVRAELNLKARELRLPKGARIHKLHPWRLLPPPEQQRQFEHQGDVWDLLDSIPTGDPDYYNSQRNFSQEYEWLLADIAQVLQNTALERPDGDKYASELELPLRQLARESEDDARERVERVDENSIRSHAIRAVFWVTGWDEIQYQGKVRRFYTAYDAFRKRSSRVAIVEDSGTVDQAEYLLRPDFGEWYSTAANEVVKVTFAANQLQAVGSASDPAVSVAVGATRFAFFEVVAGDWLDPGIFDLAREVLPEERFEALLGANGVMSRRPTVLAIVYEPNARIEVMPSTFQRLRQLAASEEAWAPLLTGGLFEGTERQLDSRAGTPALFIGSPGRAYVAAVISVPTNSVPATANGEGVR